MRVSENSSLQMQFSDTQRNEIRNLAVVISIIVKTVTAAASYFQHWLQMIMGTENVFT
jgi:hypothetical protein